MARVYGVDQLETMEMEMRPPIREKTLEFGEEGKDYQVKYIRDGQGLHSRPSPSSKYEK